MKTKGNKSNRKRNSGTPGTLRKFKRSNIKKAKLNNSGNKNKIRKRSNGSFNTSQGGNMVRNIHKVIE